MKVTDPVCTMEIEDTDAAATSVHEETTYYFCSVPCKNTFEKDPEQYTGKKKAPEQKARVSESGVTYICPMDPEVRQSGPGACPKCGMALEPAVPSVPAAKTEWGCPMHPEIVRDEPGSCPICGMALEPRTILPEEEKNPELVDMTRRFKVGVALSIPVVFIAMHSLIPGVSLEGFVSAPVLSWLELILATPVVLWAGWPFFVRGWQSIVTRNPNMFTLISLGVGVAYGYSLVAKLFPGIFPPSFRDDSGEVPFTSRPLR